METSHPEFAGSFSSILPDIGEIAETIASKECSRDDGFGE
jgi:hypothetical protein